MSEKNELDWKAYEFITQYIYAALGEKYGIKVIGHGHNCLVKGKSGATYQIDVLTEQSDGATMHRTAIECKFLKKKVTNDTVMKLRGIMEDTGIESGIIVCKTGFTRDTRLYAEHYGIKLVELREARPNDKDFQKTLEVGVLETRVNSTVSRINMIRIDFGTKVITDERHLIGMHYTVLYDASGREIPFSRFFTVFADELRSREELLKTTTIDIPTGGQLYWRLPGNNIAIER
ncbi:restriction endonuclease [Mucilaginibacter sp. Mucisp84]|uniref:restriction endonuclease n=1 Tax=Mucilaginibacter sp. Mucisp84 TaxID=3243058 RepID=UPI0039A5610B